MRLPENKYLIVAEWGGLGLLRLAMWFQVAFTDTALGGWINGMLGGLLATGKTVLLIGRAAAWKSGGKGNLANRYRQD